MGWSERNERERRGRARRKATPRRTARRGIGARACLALVIGGAWATSGCSDPAGPSEPDLRGTWDAVSAVATNPAQPGVTDDLIAGGISIRLIVGDGGAAELRSSTGDFTDVERGTLTTDDGTFSLILDGEESTGTYTLSGERLTLDLRTGVQWDFDGDGEDEPATIRVALVRQP